MGDIMSTRIKIDWLDLLIRKIHEERECQGQVHISSMHVKEGKTY